MTKTIALHPPSHSVPLAIGSMSERIQIKNGINLNSYSDPSELASRPVDERLSAAFQVLSECTANNEHSTGQIDRFLIDQLIAQIDHVISLQLDEILHHPEFQALESSWKSLEYLLHRTDGRSNIKIELLNVSKAALNEDFENASDIAHTGLYRQIYEREYDMPGGEPIAAIISDYTFNAEHGDIQLLRHIAKVASSTHCPFIGSITEKFFGKNTMEAVARIPDLLSYMERAEYIPWNAFRETEEARYIGLTCPRFLLRLPYGEENDTKSLNYREQVFENPEQYLWGFASFALAVNMIKSFRDYGWALNIRGPEAGGKVEALPLHQYNLGRGLLTKIPTEILIPETRELDLATLGFIPLCYYKNSDYACFFSANSVQKPKHYASKEATANSRINARLPYIFLSARIAHYLKVLQRETIGSHVSRIELENTLNAWLQTLITKMNNPDPEQMAEHPLKDGRIEVHENSENPGFYQVILCAIPHFQIEGIDVNLSIVGQMPKNVLEKSF